MRKMAATILCMASFFYDPRLIANNLSFGFSYPFYQRETIHGSEIVDEPIIPAVDLSTISPLQIVERVDDDRCDPFIEEIFKIKIPGVKNGYNASIIDHEDGYLMAFRYDKYKLPIHLHLDLFFQNIGIVKLDSHFKPKGRWHKILHNRCYDPRLFKIDETIYLIFASPNSGDPHSVVSSRLNMCTIHCSPKGVTTDHLVALNAPFQCKWEKNWVLFNYNNSPLLSYTINPHIVLQPSLVDGSCTLISQINQCIDWSFGIIRGGTPAMVVDDVYLGFFHSSTIDVKTGRFTYYIGAYTFSTEPPFELLKHSPKPFCHRNFYSTPKTPLSSSKVLFPGGFVVKNDKIYLCYGENDGTIKIMVLDKIKLFESMISTSNQRCNSDR